MARVGYFFSSVLVPRATLSACDPARFRRTWLLKKVLAAEITVAQITSCEIAPWAFKFVLMELT